MIRATARRQSRRRAAAVVAVCATLAPLAVAGSAQSSPRARGAHACHEQKDLVVRWHTPSVKTSSIEISINGLRYAKIGGRRNRVTIRKSKLTGVVEIIVQGTVAKSSPPRTISASFFYTPCHEPAKPLTLKAKK